MMIYKKCKQFLCIEIDMTIDDNDATDLNCLCNQTNLCTRHLLIINIDAGYNNDEVFYSFNYVSINSIY